jgi:CubicO group peptidase (beta-lactamase class C family)
MNLVIGKLVEEGRIDPARRVQEYIPEIGSGYATASVQQLLNMDVANDYTEDYDDPFTSAYLQEEAVGWRLPSDPAREDTTRAFVSRITGKDTTNRTGKADYKSANTEVLGWIAERVSGRPLRHFLADIADAAGIEGCLHMTTDRDGVPLVDGGICLTARDLARFGALFVRRGLGVDGRQVGSAAFIERTRTAGIPLKPPRAMAASTCWPTSRAAWSPPSSASSKTRTPTTSATSLPSSACSPRSPAWSSRTIPLNPASPRPGRTSRRSA